MNQLLFKPLTYVTLLALIVLGAWVSFLPAQVSHHFKTALSDQFGREATIGASAYSFDPEFGIALHDVTIAGTSAMPEAAFHADTVILPLTLSQIFSTQAPLQNLVIDGADIRVVFDGVGHSNVFGGTSPKDTPALHVKFLNSSLHYFDERFADQFHIDQVSAAVDYNDNAEIQAAGSAVANGQFINFTADLASFERAFSEGSPFDVSVDGVSSSLTFSGRLATSKRLNLAGQADLASSDAARFASWLGLKLNALNGAGKFGLTGALDSDGPVFMMTNAHMQMGTIEGQGEISFSNAGERPNLTAALKLNAIDLSPLRNASSVWADKTLDYSDLNAFDFQYRLSAPAFVFGPFKSGEAILEGTLKDRVLDATLSSQDFSGGTGRFGLKLDGTQLPPSLTLDVSLADVAAAPVLKTFLGAALTTGRLGFSSQVSAMGKSQADFISTLRGTAEFELGTGTLSGEDFSSLNTAPAEGWSGGKTGDFKAKAKLTIEDGVATLAETQIDAGAAALHGEGEVDILRQSLDVVIGTSPKFKIQGPWSRPKILPQ